MLDTQNNFRQTLIESLADTSNRSSPAISGATILSETESYYEVEFERGGPRYRVHK